jgi:protein tyrosine phosphatase (PTP) superfamily phosphohydrolase (DUF442 family)
VSTKTFKTLLGFFITMIEKYTPLKLSKETLEGIYNRLPISNLVTTSGQPTETQFRLIKEAGYQSVINLAPHNAENALADENALLAELGLPYTHIPVDFSHPTESDFQQFVEAMGNVPSQKVWVHCAANMRVSAFMYRYRCEILKEDKHSATKDLHQIWQPFGVWKKFISNR